MNFYRNLCLVMFCLVAIVMVTGWSAYDRVSKYEFIRAQVICVMLLTFFWHHFKNESKLMTERGHQ